MKESDPTRLPSSSRGMLAEGLRGLFGEVDDAVLANLLPGARVGRGGRRRSRHAARATRTRVHIVISGRLGSKRGRGAARRPGGTERRSRAAFPRGGCAAARRWARSRSSRVGRARPPWSPPRDSVLGDPLRGRGWRRCIRPRLRSELSMARLRGEKAPAAVECREGPCVEAQPTNLPASHHARRRRRSRSASGSWPTSPRRAEAVLVTAGGRSRPAPGVPGIAGGDGGAGNRYRQLTQALDALEGGFARLGGVRARTATSTAMKQALPRHGGPDPPARRCRRPRPRFRRDRGARAVRGIGDSRAEQFLVLLHGDGPPCPRGRGVAGPASGGSTRARDGRAAGSGIRRGSRERKRRAMGLVLAAAARAASRNWGFTRRCRRRASRSIVWAAAAWECSWARSSHWTAGRGDHRLREGGVHGQSDRGREPDAGGLAREGARAQGGGRGGPRAPGRRRCGDRGHVEDVLLRRLELLEGLRGGAVAASLARSIRASAAVRALLRRAHHGDLMVDGGAFNNYPIDVMAVRAP